MGCNDKKTYETDVSVAGAIATIELATSLNYTFPDDLETALFELNDPLVVIPSIRYGTDALNLAITTVLYPELIEREPYSTVIPADYPNLDNRVVAGPISYTELADFLDYVSYLDVPSFVRTVRSNPSQVLGQLDNYYEKKMSGGAAADLCSMLANPFGMVQDIISKIQGMVGMVQNILDMLPAIAAQLKSFAEMIKQKVEGIFENLRNVVQNIAGQAAGIAQSLSKIPAAFEGISRALIERMAGLESLLSQNNLDNIKESIDKMVTKGALQFKKLMENPEVILHLLFMFCKTLSSIEETLRSPVDAVQSMIKNITHEQNILKVKSAPFTRAAIEAGRPTATTGYIDRTTGSRTTRHNAAVTTEVNSQQEELESRSQYVLERQYASHPPHDSWSNLSFEPTVVNNWWWKQDKNIRLGPNWVFNPKKSGIPPNIGYLKMGLKELEMLNEVGKMIGSKLRVTSAYRSPEYNKWVGGESKSFHMKGQAMDVLMGGVDRAAFYAACKKVGFTGFGGYRSKGFIHVDTRSSPIVFKGSDYLQGK